MSENNNPLKEWTLMFLFAGDNELAPLLISQVKAIKDAGFHENAEVLVHFDPNERGVPTRLLRVNHRRRSEGDERVSIGIGRDSYVRNMGEDIIRAGDIKASAGHFSGEMQKALSGKADSETSLQALENFLGYCRENYPAKNYMLFLFGHGMVVGSDNFLPDENPRSGVTLSELGAAVRKFTDEAARKGGALQLLGLHSCAMSAIEVAYELRGTARYMIGAEGIAYVGSWPYLNLLIKLFNALCDAEAEPRPEPAAGADGDYIPALVRNLYYHALHNGTDFVLAGYSLDLTLCSLKEERYELLTRDMGALVSLLKRALDSRRGQELILLAHWEAQSYWDENYTDLYDFCFCLKRRCDSAVEALGLHKEPGHDDAAGDLSGLSPELSKWIGQLRGDAREMRELGAACERVMARLRPRRPNRPADGPIIKSKNVGTLYQYSHGLSVYFPWSQPLADGPAPTPPAVLQAQQCAASCSPAGALKNYAAYKFNDPKLFGEDSWLSFLMKYFDKTKREPRWKEEDRPKPVYVEAAPTNGGGRFSVAAEVKRAFQLGSLEKPTGGASKPTGGSGSSCDCPSIKNYPTEGFEVPGKKPVKVEVKAFYSSPGLLDKPAFRVEELPDENDDASDL